MGLPFYIEYLIIISQARYIVYFLSIIPFAVFFELFCLVEMILVRPIQFRYQIYVLLPKYTSMQYARPIRPLEAKSNKTL